MRIQRIMKLGVASAVLLGVAACSVTTEPESSVTDATVFEDTETYRALLAKIYAGLAVTGQQGPDGDGDVRGDFDEGFSHYVRLMWQMNELPTDEAVIAWGDGSLQELNTTTWGAANGFSSGMYNRVYFQVALANELLRETTADKLAERGHSSLAEEIADFRAEARFLRALSYWHGIDFFGDIPLVTEDFPQGAEPPAQETRERVFAFIVDELTGIRDELPIAGAADYGRADQGAVAMLLAKLYMNAEVYNAGSQYANALSEIDRVIGGPYQLDPTYQNLFLADNHTSPEIIFPVPQDGDAQKTWGGTTFLIHASCGGDIMSATPSTWGHDGCWWGLRTQPELVALFPSAADSPDARAIFFTEGQDSLVNSLTSFTDGWAVTKYSNLTSSGLPGSNSTHADIDHPLFRLGDAYLMYAEAVLRGGGGTMAQAVDYVNALRERAYGDQSANITENDLTLGFVLDERARELYWEGHRRLDLIRYGLFTGADYVWQWKGNAPAGVATDPCRTLYALPATELGANPLLTQNPCY